MKSSIQPTSLLCESRVNPLGVDARVPRLSWVMESSGRGNLQMAYQILVASSSEKLASDIGNMWDSGKVESGASIHIEYDGESLKRRRAYYWKVRAWDGNDLASPYSQAAHWEMGLLDSTAYNAPGPLAWEAKWIGAPDEITPFFRKEMQINRPIVRARAYISGLGFYELYINGEKVGDHVLDPAQTNYEQHAFYVTYDITDLLEQGNNAIGIILGNGWFNQDVVWGTDDFSYGKPGVLCQMHLDYEDGGSEVVGTDGSWKYSGGPILNNNIYAGEEYDARLEIEGWCEPGYDDTDWKHARWVRPCSPLLIEQSIPPIKKIKPISPVRIDQPKSGIYVYDMGQNFSGWVRLSIEAPAGTLIRLRFAEAIHENGMIDPASTGDWVTRVVQTDTYICKGKGIEEWEPRFTSHGFQYVEMTGLPGEASLDHLEGVVVHSAVETKGLFNCSDPMLNRMQEVALWTQLTNLHGVPTDCPHRERCGWLADAFLTTEMTIYNFDMAAFWEKYVEDIATTCRGALPSNIAPGKRLCGAEPDWQVAYILIPWYLYLYYGNVQVLERHYDGMKRLLDHYSTIAKDHIVDKGLGDWCEPGNPFPENTPVSLTSTAFYYYAADVMSQMAKALNFSEDAEKNSQLSSQIKRAFIQRFYDEGKASLGSQAGNVMALYLGLHPEGKEQAIVSNLADDVDEHSGHQTTGIFGGRYLHWALGRFGRLQKALDVLRQTTEPGLGFLLSQGATTFWEQLTRLDKMGEFGVFSKNHPMNGAFTTWFYGGLGGIEPDPAQPGFKHFYLKPQFNGDLDFADARFQSPYGPITSHWKKDGERLNWHVVVPDNTTATMVVPVEHPDQVREQDKPIQNTPGVEYLGEPSGACHTFRLAPGNYRLTIQIL